MTAASSEVFEALARQLDERHLGVVAEFLSVTCITALREEVEERWGRAELRPAEVGRGAARRSSSAVRSDHILWLEELGASPAQRAYSAAMGTLREFLRGRFRVALTHSEAHFARYLPGARYARHLDVFEGTADRVISTVLYLNDAWGPEDGGELSATMPAGGELLIAPLGGRLVCFRSATVAHEVLASRRPRASITGWLRRG